MLLSYYVGFGSGGGMNLALGSAQSWGFSFVGWDYSFA
jgi:hypothetical protein